MEVCARFTPNYEAMTWSLQVQPLPLPIPVAGLDAQGTYEGKLAAADVVRMTVLEGGQRRSHFRVHLHTGGQLEIVAAGEASARELCRQLAQLIAGASKR